MYSHRRKRIAGIMPNILHINIHYDCHFEQIHKSFPEWVCRMCVCFAFRLCDFTLTYIPFNFIRSRQTTEISGFKCSFFFFFCCCLVMLSFQQYHFLQTFDCCRYVTQCIMSLAEVRQVWCEEEAWMNWIWGHVGKMYQNQYQSHSHNRSICQNIHVWAWVWTRS